MGRSIHRIDYVIVTWLQALEVPLARVAIFVVYFWFGSLKILGMSPATPLVQALFARTVTFISFDAFYLSFAAFEVIIGILFLIPRTERIAMPLLALHLVTTIMPLVFLPEITWQAFLVPTLEGQYIIKNILIAASAVVVGSKVMKLSAE